MTRNTPKLPDGIQDRRDPDAQHWRIGPGTILTAIVLVLSAVGSFAVMASNIQDLRTNAAQDRDAFIKSVNRLSDRIDHILESRK